MKNYKTIAEQATMQSFLNCYLRETGNFEEVADQTILQSIEKEAERTIKCVLQHQAVELIIPVKYWSLTGRHIFTFPIHYRHEGSQTLRIIDYITLVSLITKELLIEQNREYAVDEFMLRVILSCRNVTKYVEERALDADQLSDANFSYIESEQSLLFGHLLHPSSKSKQGISEKEEHLYSPELKGEFQLHYFRADPSIVAQDSSLDESAAAIVKRELKESAELHRLQGKEDDLFIPTHPLQAKHLIEKENVQSLMDRRLLEYIGPLGKKYTATSSFRTVYSKDSKYMFKFSVPIKITNSLRVSQKKELDRGVEVSRVLATKVGQDLRERFDHFHIIEDPAYLNLDLEGDSTGFEVIIRENPFYEKDQNTSLIAGLCQDHAYGGKMRIQAIVEEIARREDRSTEEVSMNWFDRYLSISLDPILWLYETYGIALEAHQQNSVLQLDDGYPRTFYYRDNQGYYYSESKADLLVAQLPDLNRKSNTICSDEVAEERLRYYFLINHLFGLINSFGVSGLIGEEKLLQILRSRLEKHIEKGTAVGFIDSLINVPVLPCKANLLTRFHDMDELVGSLETQSVYTMIGNPIVQEVELAYER
ncbi:IucA/IucC family protein [Pseudalkalibacillus sp. A8]|uniref:IucA/IucC family protein n=1 Tax=Pseudalkalibacillus sp. A8 TaxID=3382641 RepID=UPI0038B45838